MKKLIALAVVFVAGMLFFVAPAAARDRVHYIAADDVLWNYAPQNRNIISGKPLRALRSAQLGWVYHKAIYREYTDGSFTQLLPVPISDRYLGLTGPTIHAEVGDTIVIVFRNNTNLSVDIAPGGAVSTPKPTAVKPGATRTYRWSVTAADGPTAMDTSSIVWAYISDVQQATVDSAALIGPLIVTRRGDARADGSPVDVDQEIVTLFSSQLEDQSPLVTQNLQDRVVNARGISSHAKTFTGDNAFPSINGYVYGNMPMPAIHARARVRWYLLTTMNGFDGHTPTWSGETVVFQGNRADAVPLVFHQDVVDMIPDNPGVWLLMCSKDDHASLGMEARYQVLP
ncbi:MAG TPA: multicopper oxidase domain-containing protein [Candidatus Eremiobacteraceae bacterium]|nr:multicopper oxidase domain-containing protein [Candidatus Eremiobacteraceae bacterium]